MHNITLTPIKFSHLAIFIFLNSQMNVATKSKLRELKHGPTKQ
jgi:hypothetical protein